MNPEQQFLRLTRRTLLGNATRGVGALALASLINPSLLRGATATSIPLLPETKVRHACLSRVS